MVVLSAEGPGYIDKNLWTTHKVLGVFPTEQLALGGLIITAEAETIYVLTDIVTGIVKRVNPQS